MRVAARLLLAHDDPVHLVLKLGPGVDVLGQRAGPGEGLEDPTRRVPHLAGKVIPHAVENSEVAFGCDIKKQAWLTLSINLLYQESLKLR